MLLIIVLLVPVIPAVLLALLENGQEKALRAYCRLECKDYKAYPRMNGYNGYYPL